MRTIGKYNAAIYRNMQSIINYRLDNIPILSGQSDFFLVISKNEGITQKGLSEHLYVNKSTTAKAVKNLIKNGLIRKEKDERDGRLDRLFLTDTGKQLAPRIQQIFADNIEIASKNLSADELEHLDIMLQKVLQNFVDEKERLTADKAK